MYQQSARAIFEINVITDFFGIPCGVGNLFVSVWFHLIFYLNFPSQEVQIMGNGPITVALKIGLTLAASLQLFCDDCKSMQKYLNQPV